jgi:hypothetical protein
VHTWSISAELCETVGVVERLADEDFPMVDMPSWLDNPAHEQHVRPPET